MANKFSIVPQTVVLGTVTNGFTLTFYYDFQDHSLCKMTVTGRAGTLANDTLCVFNRNGLENAAARTTSIPAFDTSTAISLELNSGDPADSNVVHGAGFGV